MSKVPTHDRSKKDHGNAYARIIEAIFAFEVTRKGDEGTVAITAEKHYHLVPPDQISAEELRFYAKSRLELL